MIVFVTGAPCSGKSTWVNKRAGPDDAVWDFDRVLMALCNRKEWDRPEWARYVLSSLRAAFTRCLIYRQEISAYVICTAPTEKRRREVAGLLEGRWIFVNPGKKVCMDRALNRPNSDEWIKVIKQFYTDLEPSGMEEVDSSK